MSRLPFKTTTESSISASAPATLVEQAPAASNVPVREESWNRWDKLSLALAHNYVNGYIDGLRRHPSFKEELIPALTIEAWMAFFTGMVMDSTKPRTLFLTHLLSSRLGLPESPLPSLSAITMPNAVADDGGTGPQSDPAASISTALPEVAAPADGAVMSTVVAAAAYGMGSQPDPVSSSTALPELSEEKQEIVKPLVPVVVCELKVLTTHKYTIENKSEIKQAIIQLLKMNVKIIIVADGYDEYEAIAAALLSFEFGAEQVAQISQLVCVNSDNNSVITGINRDYCSDERDNIRMEMRSRRFVIGLPGSDLYVTATRSFGYNGIEALAEQNVLGGVMTRIRSLPSTTVHATRNVRTMPAPAASAERDGAEAAPAFVPF